MLSKGFKYIGFHTVNGRNQPVIENKYNSANSDDWEWQVATFSFVQKGFYRGQGYFKCRQTGETVCLLMK